MTTDIHTLRTRLRELAAEQGQVEALLAPSSFDARPLLVRRAELLSERLRLQRQIVDALTAC